MLALALISCDTAPLAIHGDHPLGLSEKGVHVFGCQRVRTKKYGRGKDKLRFELLSKTALDYNHNTDPKELNILDLYMSELCKYYTWQSISGRTCFCSRYDECKRVKKVAFIFSRSVDGEFSALGEYGNERKLAFMKSSQEGIWILMDKYHERRGYHEVIDYNGMFYAAHGTGKLFRIDLSSKITEVASPILKKTGGIQKILVESARDLLLLDKYIDDSKINRFGWKEPLKSRFEVYKMNEEEETRKLVEIQSLGDRVLFLTKKYCYSVSAQHLPGCIPNCIYLTEHCDSHDLDCANFSAVFNLKDGGYRRI